jgi:fumarylacetoacetase
MMIMLNETHDASLTSWVDSANAGDAAFPIQNLPFGVFSVRGGGDKPRVGVAIGDSILDLAACRSAGLLDDAAEAAAVCTEDSLNRLMGLGSAHRARLRSALSRLLRKDSPLRPRVPAQALVPMADAELHVPATIGDYSDFFASIHHASNAGSLFRPDQPLLPNYKYVPIAYHGRASSIIVSGTPVRRPLGQSKAPDAKSPGFGPSRRLDCELELGVFLGPGNELGKPIPLAQAEQHVFGMCLVNDWSARDIQAWEYQPLGPFLGKSFGTTVSPWVVTLDALAPFRSAPPARPAGDPQPLPYLLGEVDAATGGVDIDVELAISSAAMRTQDAAPHVLARTSSRYLYWTIFQMVAHHTVNGCNLRPGDLIATGTVSGPTPAELGSLLELTANGSRPFTLPGGEKRTFLEDGDEVILSAHCRREGFRSIGFGEARGVIGPAREQPVQQ